MPQDASAGTYMSEHNFLQNNLNSLRNDFDKLESFQWILVRDDFIASLAAPSEAHKHTHSPRDLMEWFNSYKKASREVGEQQTLLN